MASDALKATAAAIRANPPLFSGNVDITALRRGETATLAPLPADVRLENLRIGNVPARWVTTPNADPARVVLYLHGGGYVFGSLDTHQEVMSRISRATGARVLGIGYRLAPENPFPAALDDALAGYRHLLDSGFAPNRIMIAGDSAGGGLTLATLVKLRDDGVALPAGAMVCSAWTDLTGSGASMQSRAAADPMIKPGDLGFFAAHYCADSKPNLPLISPVFADLKGLPPLLVQVGDDEILLDDSTRIVANARRAGVAAELQIWEGAFHVFQTFPQLPEAAEALAKIGAFFKSGIAA